MTSTYHVSRSHPVRRMLGTFALVFVVAGAVYCAYLFYTTVRALVAQTTLPFAADVTTAANDPRRPASQVQVTQLVKRKERVNILLLGIDQRDNAEDKGPWRTDTMILASYDPNTNSISMLSIPRDLWVTVPGYGENRINTAHFTGDYENYPGGGPALAKKTVWYALGVPVHYYVRVNFVGFEKIVDAMGGLTINVEKPIHDTKYPDNNYGTFVLDIPAGLQQMDGKTALRYARSRHNSTDFDRMARQQQVLLAIRDKAMGLDIPLSALPSILETLGTSVQTDLTVKEIATLIEAVRKVDRGAIRHGVIDDKITTTVTMASGAMVEVADWDKLQALVNDLFPTPAPSVEPSPSLSAAKLTAENARIGLENGTLTANLAQTTAASLRGKGYAVVRYGNADRFDHAETVLVIYGDKPYTAQMLAAEFAIKAENIVNRQGEASSEDLLVILGRDYAQRLGQN